MTAPGVPSISATELDARLDWRERAYDRALDRYIPYVGLVIGTAISIFIMPRTVEFWVPTLALVIASAAWMQLFTRVRGTTADGATCYPAISSPTMKVVYFTGVIVLTGLLVWRSPVFGFHSVAGYVHAFGMLAGWSRNLVVVGVAVSAAYAQMGGSFTMPPFTLPLVLGWIAVTLVNAVVGGGFTYFGMLSSEQSARRRRVIEELDEANRRLSETLEENAALHARLIAQAREAGILDERARMAREIHDTIAQGLTGIVTQLEAAGAADADEVHRRHLDTAIGLARESLTEARRSVQALAPGGLAEARLPDAIADMAKKWAETAGVAVTVETTGEPLALLPEIEVTLFRVAQEALANVGKHANASRAALTLSYMDDLVVLDVVDDGTGFDADADRTSVGGYGFGLSAMEQRVRRVSGAFAVESAPGEGTAISASVPALPASTENATTEDE